MRAPQMCCKFSYCFCSVSVSAAAAAAAVAAAAAAAAAAVVVVVVVAAVVIVIIVGVVAAVTAVAIAAAAAIAIAAADSWMQVEQQQHEMDLRQQEAIERRIRSAEKATSKKYKYSASSLLARDPSRSAAKQEELKEIHAELQASLKRGGILAQAKLDEEERSTACGFTPPPAPSDPHDTLASWAEYCASLPAGPFSKTCRHTRPAPRLAVSVVALAFIRVHCAAYDREMP